MNRAITSTFASAALAAMTLLAVPREAAAASGIGYVCEATYNPAPSTFFGSYGYAWAYFYSGPACTGSFLGYGIYLSQGASSGDLYSEGYV